MPYRPTGDCLAMPNQALLQTNARFFGSGRCAAAFFFCEAARRVKPGHGSFVVLLV